MEISSAKIKNFRNIKSLDIDFNSRVNVFVGDNGQGKTNLLEALYLSVKGSSFRPGVKKNFHNQRSVGSFRRCFFDKRFNI